MARGYASHLPQVAIHLETPSIARVYDYYLGGSTNWTIDREFGRQVLEQYPLMRHLALIHRQFLTRAVRHLAAQGVNQFLDIGSGVPGDGSTHLVADAFQLEQGRRPSSRVIYVDNDPVAVGHGEMLLSDSGDPRRHVILESDLRDPEHLWSQVAATQLFDLAKPVALLLVAVLHLQQPDIDGNEIGPKCARQLQDRLPEGSYVVVSHVIDDDGIPPEVSTALAGLKAFYDARGYGNVTWRSRQDISAILDGLQIVDPGWTSATEWHPEEDGPSTPGLEIPSSSGQAIWAGVGKVDS